MMEQVGKGGLYQYLEISLKVRDIVKKRVLKKLQDNEKWIGEGMGEIVKGTLKKVQERGVKSSLKNVKI